MCEYIGNTGRQCIRGQQIPHNPVKGSDKRLRPDLTCTSMLRVTTFDSREWNYIADKIEKERRLLVNMQSPSCDLVHIEKLLFGSYEQRNQAWGS